MKMTFQDLEDNVVYLVIVSTKWMLSRDKY